MVEWKRGVGARRNEEEKQKKADFLSFFFNFQRTICLLETSNNLSYARLQAVLDQSPFSSSFLPNLSLRSLKWSDVRLLICRL